MISTKNLYEIGDIPQTWVFEHYLRLQEKLVGQDIKILSVFNAKDKVPSMCIYVDANHGEYRFKDFSSGLQGGHMKLVMDLYNITYSQAAVKVIHDYEEYKKHNTTADKVELVHHDRFKVTDYQIRHWNNLDQSYWLNYSISSGLLEYYNVAPLEYFTMSKEEPDGKVIDIVTKRNYIYGYFRKDGTLFKIYLPKTPDKKFIKVGNYIQGVEQLVGKEYLIITSSMKDLMAFTRLGFDNIESIAPDSENSMLPGSFVEKIKKKYKKVLVLFDNDDAGIKSMAAYKNKHGLDYIKFELEKDLSDAVKAHGVEKVKKQLSKLINMSLNELMKREI